MFWLAGEKINKISESYPPSLSIYVVRKRIKYQRYYSSSSANFPINLFQNFTRQLKFALHLSDTHRFFCNRENIRIEKIYLTYLLKSFLIWYFFIRCRSKPIQTSWTFKQKFSNPCRLRAHRYISAFLFIVVFFFLPVLHLS